MNIFYEKSVPRTATTLTQPQYRYLQWVMNHLSVSGIHNDINDKDFKSELISQVHTRSESLKNSTEYKEGRMEEIELDDDQISSLLNEYGKLQLCCDISGEYSKYFSESVYLEKKDGEDWDESEMSSWGFDDWVENGMEDEPYGDMDDYDARVDTYYTEVEMNFPRDVLYAEPTTEKKVA